MGGLRPGGGCWPYKVYLYNVTNGGEEYVFCGLVYRGTWPAAPMVYARYAIARLGSHTVDVFALGSAIERSRAMSHLQHMHNPALTSVIHLLDPSDGFRFPWILSCCICVPFSFYVYVDTWLIYTAVRCMLSFVPYLIALLSCRFACAFCLCLCLSLIVYLPLLLAHSPLWHRLGTVCASA